MIWGLLVDRLGGGKAARWGVMVLAALTVLLAAFWAGSWQNNIKRDVKDLKTTIQTGDRIDEAISSGAGMSWRERLLGPSE